ncbi:MAG: MotE family protein [Rickettsiales endosymbiont of Dermacentor nuttalli]
MKIRFFPVVILSLMILLGTRLFSIANYEHELLNISWLGLFKNVSIMNIATAQNDNASTNTTQKGAGDENKENDIVSKEDVTPINCATSFTNAEIELLQNLSKRRKQLEEWSQSMSTKEAILVAAELKANNKINELKKLKGEIEKLLSLYNQKEDTKISSLVKIYENMKPKEAAKILEDLEMPILLEVIDRMKEAKVAPILAQMTPEKATILTQEYAKQKKISSKDIDN